MKKSLLPIVFIALTAAANAAVVDKVIVRQQWPWSTDIKVEYMLSGVTSPVDIKVKAYDGATELQLPEGSISGAVEGVDKNGIGQFTIDSVAAFGQNTVSKMDFRVELSLEEAVLYKIFDLRSMRAPVVELTAADIRTGNYGTYEEDYSNILPGTAVGKVFIWTGVTNDKYRTTHLVMRRICAKGRSFTMGDAKLPEAVKHTVSFTNDFYMAVFPMTECQHKMIMLGTNSTSEVDYTQSELAPKSGLWWRDLRGEFYTSGIASAGWWPTPGVWTEDGFVPDYTKSPHDVGNQPYIVLNWLRIRTGRMPGAVFDLPTDARWEYACRAGTLTENYAGGNDAETFGKIAWYGGNSNRVKHEVGLKAPNPWGLYDMHGNVWEWCLDVVGVITSSEAVVDPVGPESSNRFARRVVRGGSCDTALGNNTLTGFRSHAAVYDASGDNSPYGYRVIFDAH